jgi:hypothetical protein
MIALAWLGSLVPTFLYSIPLFVAWFLWGHRMRWHRGAFMFELKPGSWPEMTWYREWGGTTLGHVIMLHPDPNERLITHELKHVEQFDSQGWAWLVAGGVLVGLAGLPVAWGLALWAAAPGLIYGAAGLVAVFRGEPFYRGNHHEEAAYATALEMDKRESCRRWRPVPA